MSELCDVTFCGEHCIKDKGHEGCHVPARPVIPNHYVLALARIEKRLEIILKEQAQLSTDVNAFARIVAQNWEPRRKPET
jgi:hypothetical protein